MDTEEARRVVHEVNNALAVIGTLSELLLQARGPEDPERADLDDIQAATERAAAAVRRLEGFLRAGSPPRQADELDPGRPAALQRFTLLLVEADPHTRGVVRRFLVPRGFEVLDASSWTEATALIERGGLAVDLLVSRQQPPAADVARVAASIPRFELATDVASALVTPGGRADVLAQLESHLTAREESG
ncbi:MAG: hypothetical protein KJP18_17855 [Gemmatimonadetes bacterium]|nr:hypothetical protein [Gemmatimonadota bacterium]